jgi:hypothetical protein
MNGHAFTMHVVFITHPDEFGMNIAHLSGGGVLRLRLLFRTHRDGFEMLNVCRTIGDMCSSNIGSHHFSKCIRDTDCTSYLTRVQLTACNKWPRISHACRLHNSSG